MLIMKTKKLKYMDLAILSNLMFFLLFFKFISKHLLWTNQARYNELRRK